MGLSQEALQAVLDAGGESGAAIAAELIAGGSKAILETNALVESSRIAAAIIGQQAAKQWFGAGVSNAQSYLQGVEQAFAEAQKRLLKVGLKIADVKGISASFSGALAGPSVTPLNMKPDQGGGIPGGGSVVVNVNGVLTNAQTGQAVLDALTQYTQVYGPLNLAIR
jgi:ribosomal protein S11